MSLAFHYVKRNTNQVQIMVPALKEPRVFGRNRHLSIVTLSKFIPISGLELFLKNDGFHYMTLIISHFLSS